MEHNTQSNLKFRMSIGVMMSGTIMLPGNDNVLLDRVLVGQVTGIDSNIFSTNVEPQ